MDTQKALPHLGGKKVCFLRTEEIKSASKPGVFLPLHN